MFAVVEIAGFQELVKVGQKLEVPQLRKGVGELVIFEKVLLLKEDGDEVTIGTPTVPGAAVEAKVLSHGRSEKIRVYKMRRRKRYRRTKGHRQGYSDIEITEIRSSYRL